MQSHTLKAKHPSKKTPRVGRGGKRGKTSGRGTKGQKARAGHKIRPEIRDLIKKIPKLRGHGKNRARGVHSGRRTVIPVNLATLETMFAAGDLVTPAILVKKGLVSARAGRMPLVKILGTGELTKNLAISDCTYSESAKAAIEKAGGSVA